MTEPLLADFGASTPSFVAGIGTLALINAGLAEQKGRSRLVWFLLSLFLGPVATLLIVVLGRVSAGGVSSSYGR